MSRQFHVSPRVRGRLVAAAVAFIILASFFGGSFESAASSGTSLTLPTASQWSDLHGVNFGFNYPSSGTYVPNSTISFPAIRADGFNYLRFAFYWAEYAANPSAYVASLQKVAWDAEHNGLYIAFDMDDYNTGPQYGGYGFPTYITASYSTSTAFWFAWYTNSIPRINGTTTGWDAQLLVWKNIISHVDNYSSVIGYETMSNPGIFNSTSPDCNSLGQCNQFLQLGTLQTYLAAHLRAMTSKWILFDRPYINPSCTSCSSSQPTVEQILDAAPNVTTASAEGWGRISGVVFAPHRYALYGGYLSKYATAQSDLEKIYGSIEPIVPVTIGEWAIGGYTDSIWNSNETNYVKWSVGNMSEYGFAWTYESWSDGPILGPTDVQGSYEHLLNGAAATYSTSNSYCVSVGEFQAPCPLTVNQWALDGYLAQVISQVYGMTTSSSSTTPSTSTSSTASTSTSSSLTSSTTTTATSSTTSSGGGSGIPEFPAQLDFVLLATVVIVICYVLAKRVAFPRL